eukprot:TRINITY_DN30446_c0_g1_i1.p1 TRINITY_DN30446_c0_g1~~TRINITY_DN30446_c0_g1_i1.p1  ORF type:complete len:475 (+),score=106.08 TRINITY_DN30446_c0_g1_i1:45-1427(+)
MLAAVAWYVGAAASAAVVLVVLGVRALLQRLYHSIPPAAPRVLAGRHDPQGCVLFRTIPAMRDKIAWVPLGDYPTPVSRMAYCDPESERRVEVYLKREDLASAKYGGNKTRTLEFQLGCVIEQCKRTGGRWAAVGGPGSNQIVASAVFAREHGVDFMGLPLGPERASLDNAMNIVSMMSLPGWQGSWKKPLLQLVPRLVRAIFFSKDVFSMPGGNNPTGALGHVGAVLELCEQIRDGVLPQPRHIFLPIGSSCTTAGIAAGIAVARALRVGFEAEVTLHGVPIHHGAEKAPPVLRWAIRKVAKDTLALLKACGGPDAIPHLDRFLATGLQLHCGYAGKYGGWTPAALAAKQTVELAEVSPGAHPKPWMCSTFSSKATAAMLDYLRTAPAAAAGPAVLWCTKSRVQPRGVPLDDVLWDGCVEELDAGARQWLAHGHISCKADYDSAAARFVKVPAPESTAE